MSDNLRDRIARAIHDSITPACDSPAHRTDETFRRHADAVLAVLAESASGDTAATSPNDDTAPTDEAIRVEAEKRWPNGLYVRSFHSARVIFENGARWARERTQTEHITSAVLEAYDHD